LRFFSNVARLFRSWRIALLEPEVQGVPTLAPALILLTTVLYWLVEGWSLPDSA
jgi:hypothetical protein